MKTSSEYAATTILSSTTIHGMLLVLGLVFYGLFGLEGLADLAGEQPRGLWLILSAGLGWLVLILGYFRPFQELVLASVIAVPTACWFLLSGEGQASLLEPEYLTILVGSMLLMIVLMARLQARRRVDERRREQRDAQANAANERQAVDERLVEAAEFADTGKSIGIDGVPLLLAGAVILWFAIPFVLAGRAIWEPGAARHAASLVGFLGGVTAASVALYLTVLDPMRYVRDVPEEWPWKKMAFSLGLLVLAGLSLLGAWTTLSGGVV